MDSASVLFLAPAVTVCETEGAMDSASVFSLSTRQTFKLVFHTNVCPLLPVLSVLSVQCQKAISAPWYTRHLPGIRSLPAIALPKGRICSLVNQVYTSFPLMLLPFGLH